MEDAHATILDLQAQSDEEVKPASEEDRLSFFGVYDGHGGDKVALFAGENIHQIVAKQEAFKKGDLEQALKDGFLATDRSILNGGPLKRFTRLEALQLILIRPTLRGGGIWLHCDCRHHLCKEDLCRTYSHVLSS